MSPPKQPKATANDIKREAARYVVHNLGDQLWAGTPVYDEHHTQWIVPLHARSLPADTVIGEMTLDIYGRVIHAPSRNTLQRAVRRHKRG